MERGEAVTFDHDFVIAGAAFHEILLGSKSSTVGKPQPSFSGRFVSMTKVARIWTAAGLLDRFAEVHQRMPDRSFCFVLGEANAAPASTMEPIGRINGLGAGRRWTEGEERGRRRQTDVGAGGRKRGPEVGPGRPMPGPGGGEVAAARWGSRRSDAEVGSEVRLWWAACRSNGQRPGWQVEVVEDGADDRRVGDVGQDAPPPTALAARKDVHLHGAAEQLGPGQARATGGRRKLVSRRRRYAGRRGWRHGHDEGTKLGVRCECPVEVDEVGVRGRNEGGQQAQQLHGSQQKVGGAVRRGALEPVGQAAVIAKGEPLEGKRASGAVAAQLLQVMPVVGVRVGVGVQGEASRKAQRRLRGGGRSSSRGRGRRLWMEAAWRAWRALSGKASSSSLPRRLSRRTTRPATVRSSASTSSSVGGGKARKVARPSVPGEGAANSPSGTSTWKWGLA
jgi:hypothetical protein